jgi:ribosomal-protein-alanine N-acetyltransferase
MQSADLEQVLSIQNETGFQSWTLKQFQEEAELHYSLSIVAENKNQVAGYAVLHLMTDEAELLAIAVSPEIQRQGIAQTLWDFAEKSLRKSHVRTCFLEVRPSNEKAKSFYLKNGFKIMGTRPRYYADGENALLMKMNLSP